MEDLNDKSTNDTLSSSQWNGTRTEVQNVIEDSGIVLSAGDLRQLAKAMTNLVATGDFYADSGTANAHVLTSINSNSAPTAYKDGMRIRYVVNATNETSVVNINVDSLGSKGLFYSGSLMIPFIAIKGEIIHAIYNLAQDRFNVILTEELLHYVVNGYDLAHAIYTGKGFNVNSQAVLPHGAFFRPDGSTMYVLDNSGDTVYQYALSIPWDISSAAFASKSFSVGTQDTSPTGLFFKPDGLTMFIAGDFNDTIYQYTLSTAWDVSTASYASKSADVSTEDSLVTDVFFKDDGTKMYMLGATLASTYQYTLSTAWDVSTATYDTVGLLVGTQESSPQGFYFKSDGFRFYIVGVTNDAILQYSMTTAWDMSTASYDSVSFSINDEEPLPRSVVFSTNGSAMYVVGDSNDIVFQYSTNFISLVY